MIPLMLWATRAKNRQVRWQGIGWARGMRAAQKAVLEGTELHGAHQYAQAIAAYDRAIQLEADDREALLGRAVACHRLGKLDAALADYDRAIAIHGPTPEALNNRGCLQRDR